MLAHTCNTPFTTPPQVAVADAVLEYVDPLTTPVTARDVDGSEGDGIVTVLKLDEGMVLVTLDVATCTLLEVVVVVVVVTVVVKAIYTVALPLLDAVETEAS